MAYAVMLSMEVVLCRPILGPMGEDKQKAPSGLGAFLL
jgi:hypothetical protein